VENFSYATARRKLALLFARLLLQPAAMTLRAEGAVAIGSMAATECMGRLEQKDALRASRPIDSSQ
jgi:hypothetical protein